MARYIVRVELHAASLDDYEQLHRYLEAKNFKRFIVSGDGRRFQLPTAEYFLDSSLSAEQVQVLTAGEAARTGRGYWVLVSEYVKCAWTLRQI